MGSSYSKWLALLATIVMYSLTMDSSGAFLFGKSNGVPIFNLLSKSRVPGSFIVTFSPVEVFRTRAEYALDLLNDILFLKRTRFPTITMGHIYTLPDNSTFGMNIRRTPIRAARMVSQMNGVLYLEADTKMHVHQPQPPDPIRISQCSSIQQTVNNWGLDRLDQEDKVECSRDLQNVTTCGSYIHEDNPGSGVHIYILDSGIDIKGYQDEWNNRVTFGKSFCRSCPRVRAEDTNGHGTQVAGIALSKSFGVATAANGVAVQVVDGNGDAQVSDIVEAIEWVMSDHAARSLSHPAVINLSAGGSMSFALNTAIGHALKNGILTVVSAGNEAINACFLSPSSAPSAVVAGCSDIDDKFCHFSNRGSCVDILAPGSDIRTLTLNGRSTSVTGTSFSSPFVSGVLARYLSFGGSSDLHKVKEFLERSGVSDKLDDVPSDTHNLLINFSCVQS